jgi:hypothetical protein
MDLGEVKLKAALELYPRADTIVGTITGDDGAERRFSGWMEFASAIEAWRTGTSTGAGGEPADVTPPRPPYRWADGAAKTEPHPPPAPDQAT